MFILRPNIYQGRLVSLPINCHGFSLADGTMAPSTASPTSCSTPALAPVMVRLLNAASSEGTKKAYRRVVTSYADFSKANFPTSPIFRAPTGVLAAFITQLNTKYYAPTTLLTYMSALSYVHKLAGMPDSAQHFIIKKLLAGAQELSGRPDIRLPISPAVLYKVVDSTLFIVSSAYLRHMLQSMFLLAFHAFLRIGEITVHSRNKCDSVVQLGDVYISDTGILLVMSQFKHNISGRPYRFYQQKIDTVQCIHFHNF